MSDTSSISSTPSGLTGAGGGNMLRITGMATGLDVDSMVKKMLIGEQSKIDKAKQDQQTIQWRQEAYQQIIKDIKDLQNSFFDPLNGSNYILSSNNYAAFDVTSTSTDASTGTTVATAYAAAGATAGNYALDVQQIAKAASITGSTLNSQVQITSSTPGVPFNAADWQGKKISFDVGGSEYTITIDNTSFSSLNDVASNINKQVIADPNLNGKVSASYINIDNGLTDSSTGDYIKFNALTSTSVKIVNDTAGGYPTDASKLSGLFDKSITNISENTALTDLGSSLNGILELDINYNGTTVPIFLDNSATGKNGKATVKDLYDAISSQTGGQVTGSIDQMTGKFTLQTSKTGSVSSLSITGDSTGGSLLTALGLPAVGSPAASSQGQDAIVSITPPGSSTATTLTESSNNFTINSVSYTLSSAGTTNISVSADTQKVYDMIKSFIDKYNSIVDEIQTKLNEKRQYNYPPLTDAQKSQMKDTDVTNWNNMAKQGALRNDNNLENMLSAMRDTFYTAVSNTGLVFGNASSNSIGIDTSNDVSQGGKIFIVDDQKLKDAISQHGDQVIKLFTNISTSTDPSTQYSENGIFTRISDIITNYVGNTGTTLNSAILTKYANYQDDYSITGFAGTSTLPDQIYQQNQLINKLNDELNTKQEQYYQQFSQLETAMAQLNSQQSWLTQQLSG